MLFEKKLNIVNQTQFTVIHSEGVNSILPKQNNIWKMSDVNNDV